MRRTSFVAAMLSIAVALPAAAGTGFVVESQKLDENEPPGRSEVKRDGPRMRVDLEGGRHTILQLRDEGRLLALDHKRKTYLEIDQSMVETAARIGRVGRELQERTGMLPEGSQAAAEELLAGALGDLGELPTYTLRPTDEAGRVGGRLPRDRAAQRRRAGGAHLRGLGRRRSHRSGRDGGGARARRPGP